MTSFAVDGFINQGTSFAVGQSKNLLQCSDFGVNPWQIATTFNGTSATPAVTADRWVANSGGSLTYTAGRTANTTVQGFTASMMWGRSAGDTHTTGLSIGQVIETANAVRAQGQPVSLSFWAAAGATFSAGANNGAFIATILSGTGLDESSGKMFSGAWSGATTVAQATITPTTSMVRYGPITGTVGTGATQLGVMFSYSATTTGASPGLTAGATETIQFIAPQLEIGNSMTSYERQSKSQVMADAARYLQVIPEPAISVGVGSGSVAAGTLALINVPYLAPMRTAPTLTFTAGSMQVLDGNGSIRAVTGATLVGATTAAAATLKVTAATGMTAGQAAFLFGSGGSGIVILNSDY